MTPQHPLSRTEHTETIVEMPRLSGLSDGVFAFVKGNREYVSPDFETAINRVDISLNVGWGSVAILSQ